MGYGSGFEKRMKKARAMAKKGKKDVGGIKHDTIKKIKLNRRNLATLILQRGGESVKKDITFIVIIIYIDLITILSREKKEKRNRKKNTARTSPFLCEFFIFIFLHTKTNTERGQEKTREGREERGRKDIEK